MPHLNLDDTLKKQFKEQFLWPANELFTKRVCQNPNKNGFYTSEAKEIKDRHRKIILNQGRTDFEVNSEGLTPSQKIDLYCFYYFQMHFSSSYVFYLQEQEFLQTAIKEKLVWFIDIGCGPFTSGLAFNALLPKFADLNSTKVNYIGVDTSLNMLIKAESVSKSASKLNYGSITFTEDKRSILDIPQFIIESDRELLLILNFSYLFASNSLNVQDFIDFTTLLFHSYCSLNNRGSGKLLILQQNPGIEYLNRKWVRYKSELAILRSTAGYPRSISFKFDDLLGSSNYESPTFTVKCDLLKSFE